MQKIFYKAICIALPIYLCFSSLSSCIIAAGSYPYVESYEFEEKEDKVIETIKKFKNSHPDYELPTTLNLEDGRDGHWYFFYIYYKESDEIILTWVRANFEGGTTFAFVSVGQTNGSPYPDFKLINRDFGWQENRAQKRKFEELILKPILEELKNN